MEAVIWREGQIYLWTGSATASAIVAYAQNLQGQRGWGWLEHQSVDGVYARHMTGQSIDFSIGAIYTYDGTLERMVASATAVHLHFYHSSVNGSAGLLAYSGNVTGLQWAGSENSPYVYTLGYHGSLWSAYGQ